MKSKFLGMASLMGLLVSGVVFTSCNKDDDDYPNETKTITFENIVAEKDFVQSGTFRGAGDGWIQPGQQVQIKFNAGRGQVLSFAAMYGNSKDLFFAPGNPGIMLFNADGTPSTGDVSAQVKLWDNGTKVNSDPLLPAAGQPDVSENNPIREVAGSDGAYTYPAANEMMTLTLNYSSNNSEFTLTIRNNTDGETIQTSFSPGVWVVSNLSGGEVVNKAPFYTSGQNTTTELTTLATTGNSQPLETMVSGKTGIVTGISPVLMVVYTGSRNPIFTVNEKDGGVGLKKLAQTGDASELKTSLERERLIRRVYVFGTSPAGPGQKIEGQYEARSYEKIAFVTMFGASNDWFYANNSDMSALNTGDKTNQVSLYDNGTAWSQYPGAGDAQGGFGGTVIPEDEVIKVVDELTFPAFDNLPSVNEVLKVTVR